ncbi:hypothetical protein [Amycolatopsis saalfeldensis]|uniref:Outer membrane channel protein CpnT-like N-terminal domain-containing protein n=1 Tax=Amycolatopsis saalfeldensis TaxID=394193 RepID=A0A1H8YC05_9PSEU|nr:hypothetical protein [Amycolatopsis saalfeldensis]SEP49790.1 hypothetical protein SAMN04489732_113202 [Amycolatopsis saalfeldensis]
MPVAEPTDPLYVAAKGWYDGWPKDNEETAWQLGLTWAQAGEKMATAGTTLGQVGQTVTTAWADPAGAAAAGKISAHAQQVAGLPDKLQTVGMLVDTYATALMNTKNEIVQTIQSNSGIYASLPYDWLKSAFALNVSSSIRTAVDKEAGELQKVKVQGLNASAKPSIAKDGKEFSYKGEANLEKATGQGQVLGGTGSWELTTGANGSVSAGANTQKGLYAKAEAGAGVSGNLALAGTAGPVALGGKVDGFYGLKGSAGGNVSLQGAQVKADVLLGGKVTARGQASYGGVTVGGYVEGSAGIGAKAEWGIGKGEDGKYHFGGGGNLTAGPGGGGGFDIAVDPAEVGKSISQAEESIGNYGKRLAGGF